MRGMSTNIADRKKARGQGNLRSYSNHWTDEARCIGLDPDEYFFIQSGPDEVARMNKLAMDTCFKCPVAQDCINKAEADDFLWSMRGGYLPIMLSIHARGRPLGVKNSKPRRPKAGQPKAPFTLEEMDLADKYILDNNGKCKNGHGLMGHDDVKMTRDRRTKGMSMKAAYVTAGCIHCAREAAKKYRDEKRDKMKHDNIHAA